MTTTMYSERKDDTGTPMPEVPEKEQHRDPEHPGSTDSRLA